MKRRRINKIRGLEDSQGVWHTRDEGICSLVVDYFTELFQSNQPSKIDVITGSVEARVMHEDNLILTASVTEGEIQEATFQISPTKAPGPDEFSRSFYQDHW